jgi:hypothetical protein
MSDNSRKLTATLVATYAALGGDFVSAAVPELNLTFEGIPGDVHAGLTRRSGGREPWYPRGTVIRNERQVSILSVEELAEIGERLALTPFRPEWIGANLVLQGLPALTLLPPRTQLMFPSGATIRIDGDNTPCRHAGRAIVRHVPDRPDLEFGFVKAAKNRRGLVGWVEREGTIRPGDSIMIRLWPRPE